MARDWIAWHRAYDDDGSSLSQRLAVVVRAIRNYLDGAARGPIRVLSLCAGDGRDITTAATGHRRATDLTGCLVELDPHLADDARDNLQRGNLNIDVRRGDAGDASVYVDVLPADLLLLAGVFGNITDEDIRNTIAAVPGMCAPSATVVWTRHRRPPDLTPTIRRWFDEAGCASTTFESPGAGGFSVGVERCARAAPTIDAAARLFRFRDDLG